MRRASLVLTLLVLAGASAAAQVRPARPAPPRAAASARPATTPRNVIYFVTDGFGPASVTFARDYVWKTTGRAALAFDADLVGTVRTWATDSRVTDSAAGGTALATGHKTYNGAIAVDTTGRALATVLEGAKAKGMATGVVVTSRITHATPACFTAHVGSRAMEDEIALQQVRLAPDVFVGGGRRHFLPPDAAGGRRRDGKHLLDTLRAKGFTVATTRAEYDAATRRPFAALLADDHLAYEIDRDSTREPSLAEMTAKALRLLDGAPNGFFLMVEASRIDHAGHANDAPAHLQDILAYERAYRVAADYARRNGATLVVATSDHETGGLTLGRNVNGTGVYAWRPERLTPQRASFDVLLPALAAAYRTDTTGAGVFSVLTQRYGLADLTPAERDEVKRALRTQPGRLGPFLAELTGRRSVIGWTTGGHTAVDVNLYALGPGAERFRGNMPNDRVGVLVAEALRLDLAPLTASLRRRIPVQARGPGE